MSDTPKIRLEDVTYIYDAGTSIAKKALDHISITIEAGKINGIIGRTGSGKSTMMRLLNGLEKPTSGKVFLDGVDINSSKEAFFDAHQNDEKYANMRQNAKKKAIFADYRNFRRELCFRVGLVMQYPEYQLFEETVRADIAFGPRNMGLPEEEIAERVREAASFTGVEESWMEQSPFDLSGGQKRRVALAGIVAMRPEVLVLDEPAAGLDPRGRDYIFQSILDYQRKTGYTVIMVSHSMEDMAKYCDRVVVMNDCKAVMEGDREEVFSHTATLSQMGLDIPEITHLLQLLKQKGVPVDDNLYTVDDAVLAIEKLFDGRDSQ